MAVRRMAGTMIPDLRLSSQPHSVAAVWLVPRCVCMNNLKPNSITLAGSELVRSRFEPDSVMEFGFYPSLKKEQPLSGTVCQEIHCHHYVNIHGTDNSSVKATAADSGYYYYRSNNNNNSGFI